MSEQLRHLPSIDRLLQHPALASARAAWSQELAADAARAAVEEARQAILAGASAPALEELAQQALSKLQQITQPSLRPVINATGVIIHTNLGRAPLSAAAQAAMVAAAQGYTNLEYDLGTGQRGSRYDHAVALLRRLTGAEDALVVNNNAGAVLLALAGVAAGREVIVSRGQLVEIGGGFRVPDVMAQSGARLVEVGTTNRTHLRDYEAAIGPETAGLLRVHRSNFRILGFTADVPLAEMVALAHERNLLVIDDLGSGSLLDTTIYGLAPEPRVQESVAAGADLITFSGDKLLGGPQAGLIVGRARWMRGLSRILAERLPPGGLLSPASAAIDLLPYQLEPALAFVRGCATRVLLADEVGLGKTVQAGLVLHELRARGEGRRRRETAAERSPSRGRAREKSARART